MGAKAARARRSKLPQLSGRTAPRAEVSHALYAVVGVGVGLLWTAVGYGIAAIQGSAHAFLEDWLHLKGFFLISLGTWLMLIVRSDVLPARVADVTTVSPPATGLLASRWMRRAVVVVIGAGGTASLIGLGFPARGMVLAFMWTTCAIICFTAGLATLHTVDILRAVSGLATAEVKVFRYAPARTVELRAVVSYFTSFTLLVTIGYVFALLGTLAPHWAGSTGYVEAVRIFWPIIYVPTCTVALIYPHVVIHSLIQREKEKTLLSCQEDIDGLLTRFHELKTEDIERTNTLAQWFDRIAGTPNYVVDFGIAARTILPLIVNIASFFAKAALSHGQSAAS